MKAKNQLLKVLGILLFIAAGTMGAFAQTNDSPTQEVCPGVEPYLITPGNAANTFLWSIGSGVAGTDWTISSPTTAATNITWGTTTTPQTYIVTFREVDPVTQCYDEVILTVTVNPQPEPPVGDPITACEENPIQTITAVATAPDGATVVWYDAATGGTVVANPTLSAVGTITYYAESQMGTCSSSTRTPIVLTITPAPLAPEGDPITACEENPVQTITAVATSPDGATIVWYDAATDGNVVADPTLSAVGTVTYYAEAQVGDCVSPRTPIVLTITPAPLAPTGDPITVCEENPVQTITAVATVPSGATLIWYDAATGGNVVANPTLSAVGTVTYYAEAQIGDCVSPRTPIILTITPAPVAPTGDPITACEENPVQTITAVATVPSGATLIWYDAATDGNVVADPTLSAVGTVTYYAEAQVGDCVSPRTPIVLTITPAPLAPTGEPIIACETNPIQPITAVATASTGATIIWYDAATGGNVVADPTLSAVGSVTYYAEAQVGDCVSPRTPIVLTITPAPLAPVGEPITACETSPVQTLTAVATAQDGATIVWYDAATGGNVVDDPTLSAVGTVTYYAEAQIGDCVSPRTPIILTISPAPIPTISGPDEMCALTEGNVYTTEAGMTNYTWVISAGGEITAGGGINDNTVTVTWTGVGPQTVSVSYENAEGCSATTPTVRDITVSPIPDTSPIYHN